MRCYRRLLNISYKDHVSNDEVRRKILVIGEYELLDSERKREEEADRRGGKTILKNGQERTLPAHLGR